MLSIQNLSKSFGNSNLFENISNKFEFGSITLVVGPSGSGKTTLLNCIGRLESITSGTISYNDKDITKLTNKKKYYKNIFGFLFQNSGLIDDWTVKKNLSIHRKIKTDEIIEVLKKVKINKNSLKQKVYTLSGGEQQRVALASLLIKSPKVLLVDEPTASLDAYNANIVRQNLKKFATNNSIVIVSTHDNSLLEIANNVINLSKTTVT